MTSLYRLFGLTILLSLATTQHALAQDRTIEPRFQSRELGIAVHGSLNPVAGVDGNEYVGLGVSVLAAPVGFLVFEGIWGGVFEFQSPSLSGLMRVRIIRKERLALGVGTGLQWVKELQWELTPQASYTGHTTARDVLRVPIEATLEFRPIPYLTIRPYLGVRIPTRSACTIERSTYDESGYGSRTESTDCRSPVSLYLGASIGASF